ncbi:PIG-L deacetylase family protein [Tannockella kyphosi]|uniref:PIG-L deacetylase family protein n=1 Tax=Tannockella kyphosi TaxID=2899121 RepID=UPI0020139C85|nr:PIG-L deacetylase family protein [Tannockella kyphosi]
MNQEQIQALFLPPDITKGKKALCIQPHPDDNEVGMGGIIKKLTLDGCQVDYLTMTDGSLGALSPELTGDKLAFVRNQEIKDSGAILGVSNYHNLGLVDGTLDNIPMLAGKIAEVIREGQYDMIFCPDPWLSYEAHYDHVVTGKATAQAFISCSLVEYPKGTNTLPCAPFAIGFYFTNNPNTVIDVTDTFDTKFEAMAAHRSQMPPQLLDLYRTYFSMRGMQLAADKEYSLGEAIRVMSSLHMHCFVEGSQI